MIVAPFGLFRTGVYKAVQDFFYTICATILGLNMFTFEGVTALKETAAVYFEKLPMFLLQILILAGVLKCDELVDDGALAIYLSFATTIFSLISSITLRYFESKALRENFIIYSLECMAAKTSWIPYLNLIKKREQSIEIDYGKLETPIPGLTSMLGIYLPIEYKFNEKTIQTLAQELHIWENSGNSISKSSIYRKQTTVVKNEIKQVRIGIGGACDHVTVN